MFMAEQVRLWLIEELSKNAQYVRDLLDKAEKKQFKRHQVTAASRPLPIEAIWDSKNSEYVWYLNPDKLKEYEEKRIMKMSNKINSPRFCINSSNEELRASVEALRFIYGIPIANVIELAVKELIKTLPQDKKALFDNMLALRNQKLSNTKVNSKSRVSRAKQELASNPNGNQDTDLLELYLPPATDTVPEL